MPIFQKDPCSFANPNFYAVKHLSINWTVDFEQKKLVGSCILEFNLSDTSSRENEIVRKPIIFYFFRMRSNLISFLICFLIKTLDTRDLTIKSVHDVTSNSELSFELGDRHKMYGSPLKIDASRFKLNQTE